MFTVIFSMRFEGFNLKDTAEIMTQVFSVFPHFALSDSFSNLNIINVVRKVCQARCDMLSACDKIEDLCFIPVFSRCCGKFSGTFFYGWKCFMFCFSRNELLFVQSPRHWPTLDLHDLHWGCVFRTFDFSGIKSV
jgi:hypothetical protein